MKVKQLIKKLQKLNPEMEIKLREIGCPIVREIDGVYVGWYLDDEFDVPDFIDENQNPSDYGIEETQEKIAIIE